MGGFFSFNMRQMIATSILAIILGVVMLLYPGGMLALMAGAFWSVQVVLTFFIFVYVISEIVRNVKVGRPWLVVIPAILGALAIACIWLLDVKFVYVIVAFFFILAGINEIVGSFSAAYAKFSIFLLGAINIMIGAIVLKHAVILPFLIAWYVLFWGISRLMLALELRGLMKDV